MYLDILYISIYRDCFTDVKSVAKGSAKLPHYNNISAHTVPEKHTTVRTAVLLSEEWQTYNLIYTSMYSDSDFI